MARLLNSLPTAATRLEPLLGKRADDPTLRAALEKIGVRAPMTISDAVGHVTVVSKKKGIDVGCGFSHLIALDGYPVLRAPRGRYVPYLWALKFLPEVDLGACVGLGATATLDEVTARLGEPDAEDAGGTTQWWRVPVDASRGTAIIVARDDLDSLFFEVGLAAEVFLVSPIVDAARTAVDGLFAAWLVHRDFLDADRVPAAARELLERVRERRLRGSELLSQGFPDGLWASHLVNDRRLRGRAFSWVMGGYLEPMAKTFGTISEGTHFGAINLEADEWSAFDRAAPAMDRWIGRPLAKR